MLISSHFQTNKGVPLKKLTILTIIISIVAMLPVSVDAKGPKNPLKTPYDKYKANADGCYNDLVHLDGYVSALMEYVEGRKTNAEKALAVGERKKDIDEGELLLLLRKQKEFASALQAKLRSVINTTKSVNKKCKLMVKHYQRGVNYVKKGTTINPLPK